MERFELFYQQGLKGFSNFGTVCLGKGVDICTYILEALNESTTNTNLNPNSNMNENACKLVKSEPESNETIAKRLTKTIISKRDLLLEYFNISIDTFGVIKTLPLLLQKFEPNLAYLPDLLLMIGRDIDWTNECACFKG